MLASDSFSQNRKLILFLVIPLSLSLFKNKIFSLCITYIVHRSREPPIPPSSLSLALLRCHAFNYSKTPVDQQSMRRIVYKGASYMNTRPDTSIAFSLLHLGRHIKFIRLKHLLRFEFECRVPTIISFKIIDIFVYSSLIPKHIRYYCFLTEILVTKSINVLGNIYCIRRTITTVDIMNF